MKIIDIKTFVVDCFRTNWVFVKLYTDEGIEGVGEVTLEYKEHAVVGAIEDLREYLIGKDPRTIELHYQNIYRDAYWRGGPVLMSALSGVEQAMWDILGKSLGVPVYQLLGGKVRDQVRIYVNGWFAGAKTPDEFAKKAKETVAMGVTAMKWDPFGKAYMDISNQELHTALTCIDAVRSAVGKEVDLLVEGHGRFHVAAATKIAKELEQFGPMFFEEPIPPDHVDALAKVREKSPVPISAGERWYTRAGFREAFEKRAIDYIQPDISHGGGLLELKKIAAMAEMHYIPFAPHNPSGPVANAATLQLAACVPNFAILEIMATDVAYRKDITDERLHYENGMIFIPDGPGLGIELREEECGKYPYTYHGLRHYSGQLTDIRPAEVKRYF